MTSAPLGFTRMVLGLHPGAPRRATALAVEFAELFDIELLGLFIEDLGLRHLSGMPFAREISSLGGGWRPIEPARATRELDLAAGEAERRFVEAARSLARRQFEIVRARAGEALAATLRSGDIVAIGAPLAAAERAAEPFASLLEAAFGSSAAVMLAPARRARSAGPIVAIAAGPDDPSIAAAAAIAEAAGEELVVVDLRAGAAEDWLAARRETAPRLAFADDALPQALQSLRERLAVVSRGPIGNRIALTVAATRGVPALSVDGRER
ncbi:MAG: hypothetical protein ABSC25_20550 [Roseiarcus sp.]|jgi:hypothetical protein